MTAAELHARITDEDEFVILGQKLLPLKIGHLEMMSKFGCEYPSNPGELALAVLICAMEPHEVIPWFKAPDYEDKITRIGMQLGEWDFQEKLALWSEYWKFYTQMPTITNAGTGEAKACGVPFHQMLRSILLSELNHSPSEIADVKVLQAQWDIAGMNQHRGRISVLPEDIDARPPMSPEMEARIAEIIRTREEKA